MCVSQREKLETGNDPPRKRVKLSDKYQERPQRCPLLLMASFHRSDRQLRDASSKMSPTLDAVSSALHRHLGILCALASCTSFALMDLFAQYLLVTDPIDIVSLIFIRMTFSLFVSYAYLYSTSQSDLPFGPRQHRWILALRSILHYFVLMGFFIAIRHLTLVKAEPFSLDGPSDAHER